MQDYLPFTCDLCNKKFCSAHRTYDAHHCAAIKDKDATTFAPTCPVCHHPVGKSFPMEDKNVAIGRHLDHHCLGNQHHQPVAVAPAAAPVAVARKTVRGSREDGSRCRVSKCHQQHMTTCKLCNWKLCLDHRFEADHKCTRRNKDRQILPLAPPLPQNPIVNATRNHKSPPPPLSSTAQSVPKFYTAEMEHKHNWKRMFMVRRGQQKQQKEEEEEPVRFTNSEQQAICPVFKPNLEPEERFVLRFFFPPHLNCQPLHLAFPRTWLVGRLLDLLLDRASLPNMNNKLPRESNQRWHLYTLQTLAPLGKSYDALRANATWGDLEKGGVIQSGDLVILDKGVESQPLSTLTVQSLGTQLQLSISHQDEVLQKLRYHTCQKQASQLYQPSKTPQARAVVCTL